MQDALRAALSTLPAHPVFLTDLNAGVVALALRFHARNQYDPYHPGGDNCFLMLQTLKAAQRTGLANIVDFTPLTSFLSERSLGHDRVDRDQHEGLECLAQLGCHPGHVILPDDPEADLAIERLLAAMHLALFDTVPLTVAGASTIGCNLCALYAGQPSSARPWIGRVVGDANLNGHLSPRYHVPSELEQAARHAERESLVTTLKPNAVLFLALRSRELVARLTKDAIALTAEWHPSIVESARSCGILLAAPTAIGLWPPKDDDAPRHLTCSVCGEDAGCFKQHSNRDAGYGICRSCVDWLKKRGTCEGELLDLYGVEGVNYAACACTSTLIDSQCTHHGAHEHGGAPNQEVR